MSGQASLETAVKATRLGALDFVEKPVGLDRLLLTLRNALQLDRLQRENAELKRYWQDELALIGDSSAMAAVRQRVERVAAADAADPHPGRERHRQGADRPRDPRAVAAARPALREDELRGHPRRARGDRAVRPREGRVLGRGRAAARPLRAGRRRDAVPRRDRRHARAHAGEAAARAAGRRDHPGGRHRRDQGGRAGAVRDQPGPRRPAGRGPLPRGPVLPHQHRLHPRARRCATGRATSPPSPRISPPRPRGATTGSRAPCRRMPSPCCGSSRGRATSASCATSWSAC